MRDKFNGGGMKPPTSMARTAMTNGVISDSNCNYSITEKCLAEQQRAKGLISSKTQQSLANSKQEDLYKYHTLGRSRIIPPVVQDARSYSLMNGPHYNPYSVGMVDPSAPSPVWVMQSMQNRNSASSEGDACNEGYLRHNSTRSLSLSSPRGVQGFAKQNPHQVYAQYGPYQHHMLSGAMGSCAFSHVHQGGYESDSGVIERRSLCSKCCRPMDEKNNLLAESHGSTLSLTSTTSSLYSTNEERQAAEVQKLRKELDLAKEQVWTLTSQLTTNAQVVQAFEHSLGSMTMRLQQLQSKSDQKDSELTEMKTTIENLRRMTGLAHTEILQTSQTIPNLQQNISSSQALERQMSADSISSLNSLGSNCSGTSSATEAKKKAKKSWIRNSFSKAFGGKKKSGSGSMSDVEGDAVSQYSVGNHSITSAPTTPTHGPARTGFNIASYLYTDVDDMTPEAIAELKRMLREKEMKLTDIRLDALTSAHQLEQLREAMNKMKQEMSYLKADNERLHKMVDDGCAVSTSHPPLSPGSPLSGAPISGGFGLLSNSFSQTGSPSTMSLSSPIHRSYGPPDKSSLDFLSHTHTETDNGKRVTVSVISEDSKQSVGCFIGSLSVTGKTKWDILDSLVKRTFKQYLSRIDQSTNLGLTSESIHAFVVGEVCRTRDGDLPELLPYGYLVGDTTNIKIILKGAEHNCVDSLAFETGIPKSIIQRYVSLLSEHRRIILSGPTGTGKSHLAQHLAGYLIARSGRQRLAHSIATFDAEHKTSVELREYLCTIQELCENADNDSLPSVIILDNLHHVSSLADVFSGFLSHKAAKCPYIIGTMNQTTNATTNLQLHHNFRWVLCANHMEPVKGFLGRFLRRKLVACEVKANTLNNDLGKIIEWIPKVWQHVNKFIETHNSTDATIGPRQFLDCPMDVIQSQAWFADLWNYYLIPYLKEAVKEGLQKYGQKSCWEDPTDWLIQTYPWSLDTADLLHLRAEDVGYDKQLPITKQQSSSCVKEVAKDSNGRDLDTADPLYNMILRLREGSSYSQNDTESLDSHSSAILDTA